jgi:hypothetical protein
MEELLIASIDVVLICPSAELPLDAVTLREGGGGDRMRSALARQTYGAPPPTASEPRQRDLLRRGFDRFGPLWAVGHRIDDLDKRK